jgi:hypothetical protein
LVIEDKNWDQHAFSHNVWQNKAFADIVTDLRKQGVSWKMSRTRERQDKDDKRLEYKNVQATGIAKQSQIKEK